MKQAFRRAFPAGGDEACHEGRHPGHVGQREQDDIRFDRDIGEGEWRTCLSGAGRDNRGRVRSRLDDATLEMCAPDVHDEERAAARGGDVAAMIEADYAFHHNHHNKCHKNNDTRKRSNCDIQTALKILPHTNWKHIGTCIS